VSNEYLKPVYQKVFDQVYPQVKNENKGVLYKVIHILLEGQESKASEICIDHGINKNASLSDDESTASDQVLMEKPNPGNQLFKKRNWLTQQMHDITLKNLNNPDMATVAWLVFIGSLLVGTWYCKEYVNSRQKKLKCDERILPSNSPPSQELTPITAALCLVVQASVFIDLKNKHQNALEDNRLSCYDVKMLIDYSSHFLCIGVEDVASIEEHLEITREEITNDSNQEVYIRIHISNGQNIIGKEVPYILKRDLPSDGKRIIQRRVSLKNLSGLEQFNHI
jgi:hypothetical protein